MTKNIIISATRKSTDLLIKDLEICRSFDRNLKHFKVWELQIISNNTNGLSKTYNNALANCIARGDVQWAVFVHDDVYIDDGDLDRKLNIAHLHHGFDIIGLAGCINPSIKQHNLWHIMTDRQNLRGYVAHPTGQFLDDKRQVSVTSFGPTPSRVALIDGLFIAVNVNSAKKTNWKFNENYNFHHYDIASCIDANNAKLKIGTYPINVIHSSPGLLSINDKAWTDSNTQFIKEYAK